jgi:hypothetical protein
MPQTDHLRRIRERISPLVGGGVCCEAMSTDANSPAFLPVVPCGLLLGESCSSMIFMATSPWRGQAA